MLDNGPEGMSRGLSRGNHTLLRLGRVKYGPSEAVAAHVVVKSKVFSTERCGRSLTQDQRTSGDRSLTGTNPYDGSVRRRLYNEARRYPICSQWPGHERKQAPARQDPARHWDEAE